jgi:hypothetical protein
MKQPFWNTSKGRKISAKMLALMHTNGAELNAKRAAGRILRGSITRV